MFFVDEILRSLCEEFQRISDERKTALRELASFVQQKISSQQASELVFICTHNSRRSHIAQIWAQTAASYFNVPNVNAYSGGTEATAFNPRAVDALRSLGFKIEMITSGVNPRYTVRYSDNHPGLEVFSKKYDDLENPASQFAAIMTCTHADENCPVIAGAAKRISLPFHDPKDFDRTSMESIKYHERCLEIGREIMYAFSQIKKQ
ncbi:MAG TPA: hypothetical protein VK508_15845 [Cyclobacteriaceae bacterium]|nr:hypothetical protein [Cyclobacteriaceae bacterium]